jgi:hypothetical protein
LASAFKHDKSCLDVKVHIETQPRLNFPGEAPFHRNLRGLYYYLNFHDFFITRKVTVQITTLKINQTVIFP